MRGDCPFCAFAGPVVHGFMDAFVIEPLNPVTPGHLLVIPHEHVEDAGKKPWVTGRMFDIAAAVGAEMRRKGQADGFNLITSAGVAATQTVMHLHVHVVPRREGDGLLLPWSGQ